MAAVNIDAGMPAQQTGHGNAHMLAFGGFGGKRQAQIGIATAGTTHIHATGFFGIQVDQIAALQQITTHLARAIHTNFFFHREQHFQGRVLDIVGKSHSQTHGRTEAVICAQRGLRGVHPAVDDLRPDGVGGEIVRRIGGFLRHHIDVPLQNHAGLISHVRALRRLADINIALFVLLHRQAFFLGTGNNHFGQRGFLISGVRNGANIGKPLPNSLRLQRMKRIHEVSFGNDGLPENVAEARADTV